MWNFSEFAGIAEWFTAVNMKSKLTLFTFLMHVSLFTVNDSLVHVILKKTSLPIW